MDVFEAVRTILAVRRYKDQPVPESVMRRIVEAGRLTASAKNAQPWHFIVVQDRSMLRQLGALVPTGPYIAQASLAVVVAIDWTPFDAVSCLNSASQISCLLTFGRRLLEARQEHRGSPRAQRTRHIPLRALA